MNQPSTRRSNARRRIGRRGPLILGLLLVVSLLLLLTEGSTLGDESGAEVQSSSRVLGQEGTAIGPVGVPVFLPAWLPGDPLAEFEKQFTERGGSEGRALFLRFLRERGSALILPKASEDATAISPPWVVLAQWYAALPPVARDRLTIPRELAERLFSKGVIDAASPLLWHPDLAELAKRRLEEAIERGDRAECALLVRRPGLTAALHPALSRWLAESDAPAAPLFEPAAPQGPWELEVQVPLDLSPNPLDKLEVLPTPKHRRLPLADLHPAIGDGLAILPGQQGAFALETDPPYRRLWAAPAPYPAADAAPPPLGDLAWAGVREGDRWVVPLRTPRREYRSRLELIHEDPEVHDWHDRGWTEPGLFRGDSAGLLSTDTRTRLAMDGFTIGGIPCVTGKRVHWLATRGFDEIETWLFCLDLENGAEIWRSHLTTVALPWHAMYDLSGLLPEGRVVPYRDDLYVVARGGAIVRVGQTQGDLRGVLLYRKVRLSPKTGKWGLHNFARLPAYRPRYISDAWIDRDPRGSARLIACPPDAEQVLAVDLERWQIDWEHPAPRHAFLRRDPQGTPWVFDLSTEPGDRTIRVWSLYPNTGMLRSPGRNVSLEIPARGRRRPAARRFEKTPQDFAPLIAGVPQLMGGMIAVPCRRGLALWERDPLVGGAPTRWIPWPEGSMGGALHPLGGQRYLILHRAEPEWRSRSVVEIIRKK